MLSDRVGINYMGAPEKMGILKFAPENWLKKNWKS